jgi:uncharacterized protein (TIGR03083 family)
MLMDIFETIAEERRALADLLDTLTEEQLRTPSLMPTWTVRDVAGHLVLGLKLPMARLIATLILTRSMDKTTDILTWHLAKLPVPKLSELLRKKAASRATPPGFGAEAPLTELIVHGLDLRRPLGIQWKIPEETARTVLDFLVGPSSNAFARRRWREGIRFVVTDFEWSHGDGARVIGHADAVMLAICGRIGALDSLEGAGVAILRERFSAKSK